jgi:tRNA(Ile)-lysidine synthase
MTPQFNIIKAITSSLQRNYTSPTTFTLGVSGGADSQCLLLSFPRVAKEMGHTCIAVGIDHGFRKESNAELDLAESLAKQSNTPFHRIKVNVIDGPDGKQAHARDARYDALFSFGHTVVTAHHFDDYAETVMIRLIRGHNIGSLKVLPEISSNGTGVFRPMLSITRERILTHLKRWNINYASDPSNDDLHYLRVKIRKEIMPMFEALNPKFKERLVNLSEELHHEQN